LGVFIMSPSRSSDLGPSGADLAEAPVNFIRQIIERDLASGKNEGRVVTRFPPEPNGYLHIGHAKSIWLNFGVARDYGGVCALRFDDTNPATESVEYVESIITDVRWLGFDWGDNLRYASDYFEQLYDYAVRLIRKGKAYVDSLPPDQIREYRGTLTVPGRDSPYRGRSVDENLDLFTRMRAGEFADGTHVLRARIDMASSNLNMRDPILYRIRHLSHYRTGDAWCVYPMYDFTQCLSDAIEGVTHSLCTLEFEDHRPLYDWVLDELETECHPQQIEFSRLNLTYTVMSKRFLHRLVQAGRVSGWDDPRMPTLSGIRRRGFTPESIREFCRLVGVTKKENRVDVGWLEDSLRSDLDRRAPRAMCVLHPLRVVIDNYPDDGYEELEAMNHPSDPSMGTRRVAFSKVLYIEREDFMEVPPKGFFRLAPGREVRLRYAYLLRCERAVKDERSGEVVELHCTYDPQSKGGKAPDGRKVKSTIHWVSARHAVDVEVRLYDRLFTREHPGADGALEDDLNPDSLRVLRGCKAERALLDATVSGRFQFERLGYFCLDAVDSRPGAPIFNRAVTLRDTWSKLAARGDPKD
jgi:glutaminyl-tRNA synthetase